MEFIFQALYGLFGIGLTMLDFYIYKAFVPDVHHSVYIDISTMSDKGEGIGILAVIFIGLGVESTLIKNQAQKNFWLGACDFIMAAFIIESIVRAVAMTVVSIHIHPGKLDFLGLFVVLILFYYILKATAVCQHVVGLHDRISKIVIKSNETYSQEPKFYMPYMKMLQISNSY